MNEYEITRDGHTYTVQLDDADAERAGLTPAGKTGTAKAAEPATTKARTPQNKGAGSESVSPARHRG